MSGILKSYFTEKKKINNINISACKCLTSYNQNIRLYNSGLLLSENNILKINKKIPNSTIKTNNINDRDYYIKTESNPFNTNYFYPKKNNNNTFYEEIIFSNFLKKRQNKSFRPIYHLIPDLSINKNKSLSKKNNNKTKIVEFPNLSQKKKFNKITKTNYNIIEKKNNNNNNIKSLTTKYNTKENSIEVEKIVHHLINNNNNNNDNTKKLHHANSTEYLSLKNNKNKNIKNQKYPKEKSISPITYIDYNLKKNPGNKEFFKSFETQLKCLNNKEEYRETILNQVDTNYRHRMKVENLKNDYNSNSIIDKKKNIENFFVKNKKNFRFNIYDYYNNINKIKKNRYIKNTSRLAKIFKDNKNLLTFDKKLQNFEISTIKSIKHLDSISHKNRKMLTKILNIYNIYDLFDNK